MILNRDTFLDAVTFASKAITGRSQTPILECLRLVARDGRLTVTGSNMEMTASRSLAAEGELEACVSANRLGMFLKTCLDANPQEPPATDLFRKSPNLRETTQECLDLIDSNQGTYDSRSLSYCHNQREMAFHERWPENERRP